MAIVPIMIPAKTEAASAATTNIPNSNPPTEQLTVAMQSVSMESTSENRPTRGTSVRMSVPLDAEPSKPSENASSSTIHPVRKLVRRDSLDRREALLKGKEGTRQRRRWENDRLLSNPWATPPLPSDWEVRPTHPRRTVPYYLAPLWDAAEFQRAVESKLKGRRNSVRTSSKRPTGISPMEEAAIQIPKEMRAKLKRARAAKGLLQDLEEDIRGFVRRWNEREARLRSTGLADVAAADDEDEEIVFVGRNGAMHDDKPKHETETVASEKLVLESLEDDKAAGFARWLVHCVAQYYGLRTWSVTSEADAGLKKRLAYVGVDERARGFMGRAVEVGREVELPRPLWGMV